MKLYTTREGTVWQCSGVMIDAFHVLTAAHCLYVWFPLPPGWVDSVEVVPAMDNGSRPFGEAWATRFRTPSEYVSDEFSLFPDSRHDWALITLDRNIGSFTGWMKPMAALSDDPVYVGPLHTAGYPQDLDTNIWTMYHTSDVGCWVDDYYHGFWLDVAPGQSGPPVWVLNGTDHDVLSIVSGSGSNATECNVGTRLTPERLENLSLWIASASAPQDYPDLSNVRHEYGSFTPELVAPEVSRFTIATRVWNKGTAASTGFRVSHYLSRYSPWEDPRIGNDSFRIGDSDVPPLEPFQTWNLSWTGVLPPGVPSGEYWVGWLIDSGGVVAEFDEDDNEVFIQGKLLKVDASPPHTAVNVSGLAGPEGWYRSAVQVTLTAADDFSGVNGTMYRIDSGVWTPYPGPFDASAEGMHVLSYYSIDVAGNIENLGHSSFGIDVSPPQNLTVTFPAEGEVTHAGLVEVRYEGTDLLSGIDHYLVQLDDGPVTSAGTAQSFSFGGLADGPHTVRVTALDKAGNEAAVSTSFRVDTNIFSMRGPYGSAPIVGVFAAPVGGVVLALVLRSHRRKGVA